MYYVAQSYSFIDVRQKLWERVHNKMKKKYTFVNEKLQCIKDNKHGLKE